MRLTWDRGPMNVQCEHSVNSGLFDSRMQQVHMAPFDRLASHGFRKDNLVVASDWLMQLVPAPKHLLLALVGLLWDPWL